MRTRFLILNQLTWCKFAILQCITILNNLFSDVLPSGLTQTWSLVTIVKFGPGDPADAFFRIYADGQTPYCSVGIDRAGIKINREGGEDTVGSDLYADLFDGNFHKIQVIFDQNDVSVVELL